MPTDRYKSLSTALTITVGFLLIHILTEGDWALYLALAVGSVSLIVPGGGGLIHRAWMKLAHLLGFFIPKIILTFVFFFLLWPVAMLSRAFSAKDPLRLKNSGDSTYIKRVDTVSASGFEKPW